MVKSEPKKKPQPGGFFQKFFRKPEKNQKEQRLTVQRSIPYLEMGRDGICRVEEHLYYSSREWSLCDADGFRLRWRSYQKDECFFTRPKA